MRVLDTSRPAVVDVMAALLFVVMHVRVLYASRPAVVDVMALFSLYCLLSVVMHVRVLYTIFSMQDLGPKDSSSRVPLVGTI